MAFLKFHKKLVFTLMLCFCVLEVRSRLKDEALLNTDTVQRQRFELIRDKCASRYNDQVGWAPDPSQSGRKNICRTKVTIEAPGVRSTGVNRAVSSQQASVLAVGDSYTFGDEVSDEGSWEAALENLSGFRIYNGGGCGYGLDQTYLRAEQLLPVLKPKVLIVSLTGQQLPRIVMKTFPSPSLIYKPYFTIENEQLVKQQVPVPFSGEEKLPQTFLHSTIGRSHFADKILTKALPSWWNKPFAQVIEPERTPYAVEEVGCLLAKKFKELALKNGVTPLFLVQYPHFLYLDKNPSLDKVVECIKNENLLLVNLYPVLKEMQEKNSAAYEKLYFGPISHMTPEGNHFVANQLLPSLRNILKPELAKMSLY